MLRWIKGAVIVRFLKQVLKLFWDNCWLLVVLSHLLEIFFCKCMTGETGSTFFVILIFSGKLRFTQSFVSSLGLPDFIPLLASCYLEFSINLHIGVLMIFFCVKHKFSRKLFLVYHKIVLVFFCKIKGRKFGKILHEHQN